MSGRAGDISWTDERIAELIGLHAEGLSASVIGKRLGCTRNAILGKVYRLGLSKTAGGRLAAMRRTPLLPEDIDGVAQ